MRGASADLAGVGSAEAQVDVIAPNGPHSTTTPSTSTCPLLDRGVATKTEPRKKKPTFIELFAGTALLSKAVERVGVEVATPEDTT